MGQRFNLFIQKLINKMRDGDVPRMLLIGEITILLLAALWLGHDYLVLNEELIPGIGEFYLVTQSHHIWTRFADCGLCALWNGSIRGGFPALAELQGAVLHPIAAVTTLLFGVVNGAKYTLILSFFLAGVSQLWLGYELRLGPVPRTWAALLGVLGTHLAGRMATGFVQIVLSTSMASFVFPAVIALVRRGRNKQAVMLGLALASLGVSGQGYIQIALLFTLPAMLFLFRSETKRRYLKKFVLATVLAIMLIGLFLVPFLHFAPNLGKNVNLLTHTHQPLRFFLLNFVIDDLSYFQSVALQKVANPGWTAFYIGWIPMLLSLLTLLTLRSIKRKDRPYVLYLLASSLIIIVVGNGGLLIWLVSYIPILDIIRFPTLMTPLAVPPLLGAAAYTLDRIIKGSAWQAEVRARLSSGRDWLQLDLKWLLIILLGWNIYNVATFSLLFTATHKLDKGFAEVLDSLEAEPAQWISMPTDDWAFVEPAIRRGFKLSPMFLPYHWHFRPFPEPIIEVQRQDIPPPRGYISSKVLWRYTHYKFGEEREYAFIEMEDEITPCNATSNGGYIVVECNSNEAGKLVVKENFLTGWQAYRDGVVIDFHEDIWIRVPAPAGSHSYEFRYLPLDALFGYILSLAGMGLAVYLWFTDKRSAI